MKNKKVASLCSNVYKLYLILTIEILKIGILCLADFIVLC